LWTLRNTKKERRNARMLTTVRYSAVDDGAVDDGAVDDDRAAKRRGWLGFRRNARTPAVRTPLFLRGDEAGTKACSGTKLTDHDVGTDGIGKERRTVRIGGGPNV
jgi:hypothetical protein